VLGALSTLAFVVVFNFFLFRIVNPNPVDSMFRGRNLTRSQLDEITRKFNLDGSKWDQFIGYLRSCSAATSGLSFKGNRPVADVIGEALWPTMLLVGTSTLLSMLGIGVGYRAGWRRGSRFDHVRPRSRCSPTRCPTSGWAWCSWVCSPQLGWFPVGGLEDSGSTATGLAKLLDQLHHMALPCDRAGHRVHRRVHDRDALGDDRDAARGLPAAGSREGAARRRRASQTRRAQRASASGQPQSRSTSASSSAAPSPWSRSSPGRASGRPRT
jgi:hypothetical protein